jgi:uncharacterized protein
MLWVKTQLKMSNISGLGLFADEPIPKGAVVWRFEAMLDILYSEDAIKLLSESAQKQFHNYAFLDKTHQKYMLCGDDARFFNHSDNPNCDDKHPNITYALRDISAGEEMTVNYRDFYGDIDIHPEIS